MGRRPIVVFVGVVGLLLPLTRLAAAASPHPTTPPGNNGTVKVDGHAFDAHPGNEPHVGCEFQIDFFNYDEGDLDATYRLELWSPTGTGPLADGHVGIGEDPNGGGTDLDASVTIDLTRALDASGAATHPQQGWHVRLTVHAEGSIGADVKHKMLWVRCAMPAPSPSPTPSPGGSPSPSPTPSATPTPSASPSGGPSGSPSPPTSPGGSPSPTSPSPSTTVLSDSPTPSTSVLDRSPGGPAAFTGGGPAMAIALVIGGALLLAGTLSLRVGSRGPGRR